MTEAVFDLCNKLIKNYLFQESFKHSPRDRAVLKLFEKSELKDISGLLEDYHGAWSGDRNEIFIELKYAMSKFLEKHGIFDMDTLVCLVRRVDHIQYINISVYIKCNNDKRAMNVLKLKEPDFYELLSETLLSP